jgi:PAS domain S-box-containing protein
MATILVVDDLSANRKVLVALLRSEGHRLLEAADGEQALTVARAERPDLVITDVLMPIMDGYELVRQLRLEPATRGVAVVFYTAHYAEREARSLALSCGVADVLVKPSESEEVLRIIDRALAAPPATVPPTETPSLAADFDRDHLRLVTDKLSEKARALAAVNARLRALIDIGLELASERDPDRLLQSVCVSARDLFGATYVTLGILDRGDRTIQRLVSDGVDITNWMKLGDSVSGLLRTVVVERRVIRGNNAGGNLAALALPAGHPEAHAFLAAPILSPAQVYGWLCLVGNEGRTFSEEDEHLVTVLAGQVGRIYENGYFYNIARQRARELEQEIAERNKAIEALRVAEERMRFAFESANVGIWDLDYATGVLRWSETLERQYGLRPGTFGGTFDDFARCIHPADREATLAGIGDAVRSGKDFSLLNRAIWPDGSVHWLSGAGRIHLDQTGKPIRGIGISLDITERRLLEEQYQQAQKMEAIGRLAGGVAHDFNNLLTAILGYCELLLADLSTESQSYADISEIQKAGNQAAGLTRQLLVFSRKEIIEPTILNLNLVIGDMRALLRRLIGEDVNVVLKLRPELAQIKADRGQMEQIIMNLAVNARDAMPSGGTLIVETANVELDEHYAKIHIAAEPGAYVALIVSDTGSGMTPEVQARLFEPFFTTKEQGKGTGLGLATVHGIVARNGGSIQVYSETGKGTAFKIYFPRVEGAYAVPEIHAPTIRPAEGKHTVLVVEDGEALRDLAKRLLERLGYAVHVAGDGAAAFRIFERHPAIDVLLTDVVMPGASGPDLAKRLVASRPALKVIYMSGYTDEAIVQHGVLKPGVNFLNKPFTSETLAKKLREVLER